MTKEEAIDVLKHNYPSSCYEDLCKAVDMAIEALTNTPNTLNALDTIYRQAAIDVAKEELDNGTFYDIPSKIESLPSAQPDVPDRKVGKWIEEVGMLMCSECGDAWGTEQFDEVMSFNFCPNCGAKMEGRDE